MTRQTRYCDGVERRDFLRLGLFGLGLTLPALLERQAQAAENGGSPKDVSLIFLFLHGGLSSAEKVQPPARMPGIASIGGDHDEVAPVPDRDQGSGHLAL